MIPLTMVLMSGYVRIVDAVLVDGHVWGLGVGRVSIFDAQVGGNFRAALGALR